VESSGFILSEAAEYAFKCQDVFPDIVSFAAAIPDHLKQIFLIPIRAEVTVASSHISVAKKVADGVTPSGATPEGDLFSYQTFKYEDVEPTIPSSEPGSIFDVVTPDSKTRHQDLYQDENIQVPTDTSYMSDVDITQYVSYPYRTEESPVRHSSTRLNRPLILRVALTPEYLLTKAVEPAKDNAKSISIKVLSHDPETNVFSFTATGGKDAHTVNLSMIDDNNIVLNCDCKYWQYNGPEYHAKRNKYLLGAPMGTAETPNVRDPDKKIWLCKHTYAALKRFESYLNELYEELPDENIEDAIQDNWAKMDEYVEIPIEEIDDDDIEIIFEDEELQDRDDSEYEQVSQDDIEQIVQESQFEQIPEDEND
jgi:hypothetical protein